MTTLIQANYEQLRSAAKRFGKRADATDHLHQQLRGQSERLLESWQGRGATAFFDEMQRDLLPAVQRLSEALRQAQQVTHQVAHLLREAEEEAAALFVTKSLLGDTGHVSPYSTEIPVPLHLNLPRAASVTPQPMTTSHSSPEWDSCTGQGTSCYEARWHYAHGYDYDYSSESWIYKGRYRFVDAGIAQEVLEESGISLDGDYWTATEVLEIAQGVSALARKIGTTYEGLGSILGGHVQMYHPRSGVLHNGPLHDCFGGSACAPPPPLSDGQTIYWNDAEITLYTTVHELAHIIDWNNVMTIETGYNYSATLTFSQILPPSDPLNPPSDYAFDNLPLTRWEEWADVVSIWVYGAEFPRYKNDISNDQRVFLNRIFKGMR